MMQKTASHELSGPLALQLFGSFQARRGDTPITGLQLREGERLLASLVLSRGEAITSYELSRRFWPSEAQNSVGRFGIGQGDFPNVRQALRSLRQALGPDADRLTRPTRATVRLDMTGIEVDLFTFDTLAKTSDNVEDWRRAVALYRGPVLADWDESWIEETRRSRKRVYEALLQRLAGYDLGEGRGEAAEMGLRRLLDSRPEDDNALYSLLRLLDESGRYREALNLFAEHEARWTAGASPSFREAIRSLRESIRQHAAARIETAIPQRTRRAEEDSVLTPDSRDNADLAGIEDAAGGAVPVQSPFYVMREEDAAFHAALSRHDSIVLVKGARQAGKTSLLGRGLHLMRSSGANVVLTDFEKLNAVQLESPDSLYRALAGIIASQLDLSVSLRSVWDEDFGPNMNLERFLRRHVLTALDGPLIWGMDGVDRLFSCPFGDDVFGLFRSWHNERSLDPNSPLGRVTLAIAYATEAHLLIRDPNQSPFNVGTRLTLADFTIEQIADLNERCGRLLTSPGEVRRFFDLLGGHPYLVRLGLAQIARGVSLPRVEDDVRQGDGDLFRDHLRRLSASLVQVPHLQESLRQFLRQKNTDGIPIDDLYLLRTAGILTWAGSQDVRFRCRLYAEYFARLLVPGGAHVGA